MEINTVRETDYEPLRKLFLKERQTTFSWLDTSEYKPEDFDRETKGELILTALYDDVPVGFISIWLFTNFIHHLYVDQDFQGKGIGTELLKAAIIKTQLPIRLKCLENNTKAIHFYLSKGFTIKEKGQSNHGAYIMFELLENIH